MSDTLDSKKWSIIIIIIINCGRSQKNQNVPTRTLWTEATSRLSFYRPASHSSIDHSHSEYDVTHSQLGPYAWFIINADDLTRLIIGSLCERSVRKGMQEPRLSLTGYKKAPWRGRCSPTLRTDVGTLGRDAYWHCLSWLYHLSLCKWSRQSRMTLQET